MNELIKFTVRLNKEESEILNIKSKQLKLSKSEVVRMLINTKIEELEIDLELKKELIEVIKDYAFQYKKIGTVLNQVNKNYYQNKSEKIEEIERSLNFLWQSIKQLME